MSSLALTSLNSAKATTSQSGPFTRIETDVAGVIDAPVAAVWDLFCEWSALHRWMNAPLSPKDVISSGLRGDDTELDLPRTRMVCFSGAHADEPPVAETLLHADMEARTLYYRVEGVRPSGYRNYLCYTTMDAAPGERTLLRLNARLDAPSGKPAETVRDAILGVHREGIIETIRAHFDKFEKG